MKIGAPSDGIYSLTPRQQPELAKSMVQVTWQINSKSLHVSVKETSDFGVYKWMKHMDLRHKETKEGPFVDLNKDALLLKMFDSQNNIVAIMQFKSISYSDHTCTFKTDIDSDETLIHHFSIKYQECEKVAITDGVEP